MGVLEGDRFSDAGKKGRGKWAICLSRSILIAAAAAAEAISSLGQTCGPSPDRGLRPPYSHVPGLTTSCLLYDAPRFGYVCIRTL
ncbi:hypothetical protein BFP70_09100 [Thioclava sp. SK-1]|nr:hypothetical protein BFP70_09100 [Thioclava sp. SK-1]